MKPEKTKIEAYHLLAERLDARDGNEGLNDLATRIQSPAPAPAAVLRAALALQPARTGARTGGGLAFFPAYRYEAAAMILFLPVCAASFWLGSGLGFDLMFLP